MATTQRVTRYPWHPASTETGNLAVRSLRDALMKGLRNERGIHAETCLTAAGAIAGFAAQAAALTTVTAQVRDPAAPPLSIAVVRTTSGESFLFGDAINVHLFQEPTSHLPLVALVGGAAVEAGVPSDQLPNYREIAAHVANSVGRPDFGAIRAPGEHAPHLSPLALLKRLWAPCKAALELAPPKRFFRAREEPLQEIHWPILAGVAASQLLTLTAKTLDPRISAALIMEAAVITAKIDPQTIEPKEWKIAYDAEQKPRFVRYGD